MKFLGSLYTVTSHTSVPRLSFGILIDRDCFVYQAHFPGHPITPGVCLIAIARELYEQHIGAPMKIEKIVNAKFLNVVDPRDVTSLDYIYKKIDPSDDGSTRVSVDITGGETVYARVSMILRPE